MTKLKSLLTHPTHLQKRIWEDIIALDEKYKLPIYLHYYEGYKTEEIAKMLKVNHAMELESTEGPFDQTLHYTSSTIININDIESITIGDVTIQVAKEE
jgi:hypothetical protein